MKGNVTIAAMQFKLLIHKTIFSTMVELELFWAFLYKVVSFVERQSEKKQMEKSYSKQMVNDVEITAR